MNECVRTRPPPPARLKRDKHPKPPIIKKTPHIQNLHIMTNSQRYDYINLIIMRLPALFSTKTKEFIACQFALESDFGQSILAQTQSNHCGMKLAKSRLTTRLPESPIPEVPTPIYASYDSMKDCVVDYVLWLQSNGFRQTSTFQDWCNLMPRYCPEPNYLKKIEAIKIRYDIWKVQYEKVY